MLQLDIPRFETPFSRIVIILFCLAGFILISCAPKPRILPQDRTPENVLKCALKNRIEFETFAGLLDLKLEGEKAKFSGTMEFFYKAPDTFAFYPRTLLGMDVLRAKGEDVNLTIYLPKENEYYSGSFSDMEKTRLWNWKISFKMLLDMILGRAGLNEQDVRYTGISEDLFLYKWEDENWIKEYEVDASRCRLKKSQFMQKREGEVYQIEYKNFVSIDQVEIPKVIKIKSLTNESAQITFQERRFNLTIPGKRFELQIPPDAKRVVFEKDEQ